MRTLEDLLYEINKLEDDRDVTVDGEGTIAVVAPVCLTPAARTEFGEVLKLRADGDIVLGYHSEDYEAGGTIEEAWRFLTALAGYCSTENYEKWFEGEEAAEV